jgi:glycosyltransferase involved in cell wall biosynthesis
MPTLPTYALITAARDEAAYIELTLKSVVAQIARPIRWIIVSDGSTDGTDEIVKKYAADHPWIELMRMPERRERHFGGKAQAVNAAYATIRHLQFQAIGNLDGDVSFDETYFAYLLGRLDQDPALGIVGTSFRENGNQAYDYRFASDENVPGPCQLFRRECFEQIGGYAPMKHGGVDHVALITARMSGWKTRAFTDRAFIHHRPMGKAQHSTLGASFNSGIKDYRLGGHPIWEVFRVAYQIANKPILLGALGLGGGYLWAAVRRVERQVPPELVAFHRHEQMRRLGRFLKGLPLRKLKVTVEPRLAPRTSGADAMSNESNSCDNADSSAGALELPAYVLITPARNEAQFIELTIKSVIAQSVRPLRWVIVSDGSTDGTDDIVRRYAADHPWIELMRMPERRERHFGGKARAVNAAYAGLRNLQFESIGCLDGDISFGKVYFAFLLSKLAGDPALGIVGTPFQDISGETYDYRFVSLEHVSGACQVFRRKCFEDINGYIPIEGGGVDHVALVSARMKGWKTRTFTERVCLHHRKIGTAEHAAWRVRFRIGVKDYTLGGHPIW